MAVIGGTMSEELRDLGGKQYHALLWHWVDELRKTCEGPDGTSIAIHSSPPSSSQHKRVITCDAMRSCIMEREARRMF
jgi:hypothetical protein